MSLFQRRRSPVEIISCASAGTASTASAIAIWLRWCRNLALTSTQPLSFAGSSATRQRSRSESDHQGPVGLLARRRDLRAGRGKWKYPFRAVDKHGQLIAFMPSDRRKPEPLIVSCVKR